MLTRRQFVKGALGSIAGLTCGLGSALARAQNADSLAIVVAKDSPILQLSEFELKKLYMGTNINSRDLDDPHRRIMPEPRPARDGLHDREREQAAPAPVRRVARSARPRGPRQMSASRPPAGFPAGPPRGTLRGTRHSGVSRCVHGLGCA